MPTWDRNNNRKYWDVGEDPPFRPSKDRSQAFLVALAACDGKIHDLHSLDIREGEIIYNMKPGSIAILFRISLPAGAEARFEELMGEKVLSEIPVITLN